LLRETDRMGVTDEFETGDGSKTSAELDGPNSSGDGNGGANPSSSFLSNNPAAVTEGDARPPPANPLSAIAQRNSEAGITTTTTGSQAQEEAGETSLLVQLARTILAETEKVSAYLQKEGITAPSFSEDSPADFPKLPEEITKSRQAVVLATAKLRDLVVGPRESLRWMAWDHNNSLSLRFVNQFKVADVVPPNGEKTFGEIAEAIGVNEMDTRRLLRHAMTNGIFREENGKVSHTAKSRLIRDDAAMKDWLGFNTEDMWPVSPPLLPITYGL
jgi:hypothetical protein